MIDVRAVLGIHFCPTCEVDAMALDPHGICGFCDTVIDPAKPERARMCRNGRHEMTEANTSRPARGGVRCRECQKEASRRTTERYRARRRRAV